jgi:hypothetical protein
VKFADDVDPRDLELIEPALLILINAANLYCYRFNLPFQITSIQSDRENIKSVSKTHEQGRAIDISVKGWTDTHVHRFVYLLNQDYADIAAISYSDNQPKAAVYHDAGYGSHIHLQVRPNAKLDKFVKYYD